MWQHPGSLPSAIGVLDNVQDPISLPLPNIDVNSWIAFFTSPTDDQHADAQTFGLVFGETGSPSREDVALTALPSYFTQMSQGIAAERAPFPTFNLQPSDCASPMDPVVDDVQSPDVLNPGHDVDILSGILLGHQLPSAPPDPWVRLPVHA